MDLNEERGLNLLAGGGEEDWLCLGGTPLAAVVQTVDLRNADDLSLFGRLNGTRHWRIFRQSVMTTAVMIIAEETA